MCSVYTHCVCWNVMLKTGLMEEVLMDTKHQEKKLVCHLGLMTTGARGFSEME